MKKATAGCVAAVGVTLLALAGCVSTELSNQETTATPPSTEAPSSPSPDDTLHRPAGTPEAMVSNLEAPWSIVRLDDGSALISQRDTGSIIEVDATGTTREAALIPNVAPKGEGGLLGIAINPENPDALYAYYTSATDNRVVRMPLLGEGGDRSLGEATPLLTGIPKASIHNGGRIAFGPDGALYIATGDAGNPQDAQNPESLAGKILRINADGSVPADNPFPGSAVYTLGHRNVQGLAWTSDGRMWASEFGQGTWDELNLIKAGANYGWPEAEGSAGNSLFQDPVAQWKTAEASPSGLAAIGNTLFMASLRGERIWTIDVNQQEAKTESWFSGDYGRIRDVVAGPGESLWFITNNTDGRGTPDAQADTLYSVGISSSE